MKTFISFITFLLIAVIGNLSLIFFQQSDYVTSGLLTLAGFISLNGWVYYLIPKPRPAFK